MLRLKKFLLTIFYFSRSKFYSLLYFLKFKNHIILKHQSINYYDDIYTFSNSLFFQEKKINKILQKFNEMLKYTEKKKKFNNFFHNDVNLYYSKTSFTLGNYSEWEKSQINYLKNLERIAEITKKSENKNYRIIEPLHLGVTLGSHLHIDTLIKGMELGIFKKEKIIIPLNEYVKKRIVNNEIFRYWSNYVEVVFDEKKAQKYLQDLNKLQINPNEGFVGKDLHIYSHSAAVIVNYEWNKFKKKPLLVLENSHIERGKDVLKKLGVSHNDWYVVVHIRDNLKKDNLNSYNPHPETYIDAIESITKIGGKVILLSNKQPFPKKIKGLIEYGLSDYKSDWMDIYLLGSAKFILGTSSGPSVIGFIFNTPVAMTNYASNMANYLGSNDIFIPKNFFDLKTKKKVSFNRIFSFPLGMGSNENWFKNICNVESKFNSAKEIKDLTLEMIEKVFNDQKYIENEQQKRFKKITEKNHTILGPGNLSLQANISKKYLGENLNLL